MKIILISLLLGTFGATAQVYQPLPDQPETGILTISLRGGAGLSTVVGRDASDSLSVGGKPGYKTGLTLGLSVTSHLKPTFWLGHELWLQQQGAIVHLRDENGQTYTSRLRIQYLTIYPANFIWVQKSLRLYVGPYVGMVLAASIQRKDPAGHLQTDASVFGTAQTLTGDVSKIDAGLCLGMDYTIGNRWMVGLRLQRGVIPIWNENTLSQAGQSTIYNQNGMLTVGYQLSR